MKKQADLRLLRNGVVFGPTDREGLEKLLASGRITTDDRVSVRNAAWIPIGDFLAAPAAPSQTDTSAPVALAAPPVKKKGELKVLTGGRMVSGLHRDEVERLWKAARVKEDDLICALGGPWMRAGDFFAPPPPPVVALAERTPIEKQPLPMPILVPATPKPMPVPMRPPQPADDTPYAAPPAEASPQLGALVVQPGVTAPTGGGYRVRLLPPPPTSVSDEWFVRVRGVHSAPLKKQHVKALFQAREITLDNVARHPTWAENDWRPISSIATLADIGRA